MKSAESVPEGQTVEDCPHVAVAPYILVRSGILHPDAVSTVYVDGDWPGMFEKGRECITCGHREVTWQSS